MAQIDFVLEARLSLLSVSAVVGRWASGYVYVFIFTFHIVIVIVCGRCRCVLCL